MACYETVYLISITYAFPLRQGPTFETNHIVTFGLRTTIVGSVAIAAAEERSKQFVMPGLKKKKSGAATGKGEAIVRWPWPGPSQTQGQAELR